MIDKSIRIKREELKSKASKLRELAFDGNEISKNEEIRNKQDKIYRQWKFYDNLVKILLKLLTHWSIISFKAIITS